MLRGGGEGEGKVGEGYWCVHLFWIFPISFCSVLVQRTELLTYS